MNSVILCEGKSDAILLIYYLEKTAGWKFTKSIPDSLHIKQRSSNDSLCWYQKGQDKLLICSVGGKDNFGKYFKEQILHPMIRSNAFGKLAIVTDRDSRKIEEIESGLRKEVYPYISNLKNNDWTTSEYLDSFEIRNTIDCLLVVIPDDCEGALETVLLNAISENPYDKNIVDRCRNFVKDIKPEAEKYISSNRLRLKAELSVTWAIQSPQKVFDFIDEEIRSVKWENSALLNRCFCKLVEI